MFAQIMTSLYEVFYSRQDPVFRDEIYPSIGLWLLLSTLALVIAFYYGLNWARAKYSKSGYWWCFLLISVCINAFIVLFVAAKTDAVSWHDLDVITLAGLNAAYAGVAFFVASFLLKWRSPHARCTPF